MTVNDASLVLRVTVGAHAVLFPGDLEADGEGELAGRPALGDVVTADVLKVPTTAAGRRPATSCWTPWPRAWR